LARKRGIEYAAAFVGFNKYRGSHLPVTRGIVVADFDVEALRHAEAERESRNRPVRERAMARRSARERVEDQMRQEEFEQKRQELKALIKNMFPGLPESNIREVADRAMQPGRVGTNPALTLKESCWLAVAAYAAYGYLGFTSKVAADQSRKEVHKLLRSWGGPDPVTVVRNFQK
jgi:hypothetical protein